LFDSLASEEMLRRFGLDHDGPLDGVDDLWQTYRRTMLGRNWRLSGKCVVWLLAPNLKVIDGALPLLIARGVDLRLGTLDVREVMPGREWSISLDFPEGEPWVARDRLLDALLRVANRHAETLPEHDRSRILCEQGSPSGKIGGELRGEIGWNGLAGPVVVQVRISGDSASWEWYSHWWTEGEALPLREEINKIGRLIRDAGVPTTFRWDADAEDGGRDFQTGLLTVLDAAWHHLVAIGATKLDKWATLRAPVGSP
jgi:hypothetical protein